MSLRKSVHAQFNKVGRCPLCPPTEDTDDSPYHLMLSCQHATMKALNVRLREEASDVIPKACAYLTADMKAGVKLTDEEKIDLDNRLRDVRENISTGDLNIESEDSNNVIYRFLAVVPFPEKLGKAPPGESRPLIKSVGRLLDKIGADKGVMRRASNLLVSWSTGWIFRFAQARKEILPPYHYFEKEEKALPPEQPDLAPGMQELGSDSEEDSSSDEEWDRACT